MRRGVVRGAQSKRRRGPAKIAEVDVDLSTLPEPLMVSDLSAVDGRSDRLSIAISGVAVGNVTLDFVADQVLREGKQLSRHEAEEVVSAVSRTVVLDKALDLLAVRARSSATCASGCDARERPTLRSPGRWIDWWPRDSWTTPRTRDRWHAPRCSSGGVSRRKVVTVLRKRGVSAEVADEAIDATLSEVELDEYGAALAAAEKRVRALSSLDAAKAKAAAVRVPRSTRLRERRHSQGAGLKCSGSLQARGSSVLNNSETRSSTRLAQSAGSVRHPIRTVSHASQVHSRSR